MKTASPDGRGWRLEGVQSQAFRDLMTVWAVGGTPPVQLVSSSESEGTFEGEGYRAELTFGGSPPISLNARVRGQKDVSNRLFPFWGWADAELVSRAV
jgi:hypothetical protein